MAILLVCSLLNIVFCLELGQLDVVVKEHKLEMERKVEHLQEALEKSQKEIREKDQKVSRSAQLLQNDSLVYGDVYR